MTADNSTKIRALTLFLLWGPVYKVALGGIKYSIKILDNMKIIKPIILSTQRIDTKNEIYLTKNLYIYSKRGISRVFYNLLFLISFIKAYNIIKHKKIQIIISPGAAWINDVISLLLHKLFKINTYTFFYHWPYNEYSYKKILYYLRKEKRNIIGAAFAMIERKLSIYNLLNSKLVFTISEKSKEELIRMGVPEERIIIAYPGIDEDFIKCERKNDISSKNSEYDVITVMRISPEKGIFDLIEITKLLVQKYPNIKIGVIGHPTSILHEWINTIRKNNLEKNIIYIGTVEKKDLIEILAHSKIFIFPSHKEGFGIAVAEAMACGLPVICYDIEPLNKIFNSGGVIFVPEYNFKKFSEKIIYLLENKDKIKEMGEINRLFSRKFSWKKSSYIIEKNILKSLIIKN